MQDVGANVEGNKRVASDTGILAEEDIESPYKVCDLAEYIPQKCYKIAECILQCISVESWDKDYTL